MSAVAAPPAEPFGVLHDPAAPLSAILRAVRDAEAAEPDRARMRVGLTANLTVDLLATYIRRHALLHGVAAEVHQGALDAHLDNVRAFAEAGVEHLLVLNVFDFLAPSFEAQVSTLDADLLDAHRERTRDLLTLVLGQATGRFRTIDVARFHRLTPPTQTAASHAIDAAIEAFNTVIDEVVSQTPDARTFAVGDALAAVGHREGVDRRFHLRFRAPYTTRTCDELARRFVLATRAGGRYLHKALVLDCDGTLWGGVIGEDGLDGIALDPHEYPGNAYWAAQHAFLALQRQGVLLCLASKNEPADVAEALERHPAQVIRPQDVVLQKVSWEDKVTSLRAIADELGIGLESLVFVDDSPFEIEAVRARLPEVTTFLVPRDPWAYPGLAATVCELFSAGRPGDADADKTQQYRIRAEAHAERARHATEADYLRSLELRVDVRIDERPAVTRIAELTQKSNQFNLTTRRYTEGEIAAAMDDPDAAVVSLHVHDRFGDHGLTGVAVLRFGESAVDVEAFLMSCRIIGRGIERACWAPLAQLAASRGCTHLSAEFRPTAKNAQVAGFYDSLGMQPTEKTPMSTRYRAALAELDRTIPDHITVHVA